MKIFVAIPVYDGKLQAQSVVALLQEQAMACACGDEVEYRFLPACSQIAMGRNQLAQDFLASSCDRLFFLDADVSWEPGSLLKTAHRKEHFVGGAYRYKTQPEAYPVSWLPDPQMKGLRATKTGLLRVETVPGGFLSLSRQCLEILRAMHLERSYVHQGRKNHCWYQQPFKDGQLWSEDALFCREWRDFGGKVYLDPELSLTHWDFNVPYPGHIGNWLRSRAQGEQK